jgi:8-oxo-dGTP pyrophosphatase MutT (NUDIX family)
MVSSALFIDFGRAGFTPHEVCAAAECVVNLVVVSSSHVAESHTHTYNWRILCRVSRRVGSRISAARRSKMPLRHRRHSVGFGLLLCRSLHALPSLSRTFLEVVRANNNAAAAADTARLFVVGGTSVGRVLEQSAVALGRYPEVFSVSEDSVTLRAEVGTNVQERTIAVARVLDALRAEGSVPMLEGWRDEQFAIRSSFFAPTELTVERAAAGLFGCPAYGVFVVGYVADEATGVPSHVWIGRRSPTKPTWPGLLDCLAAGGMAAGEIPLEAARKEAAEEAGISAALAANIRPSGGVCYTGFDQTRWALKRDVLYTFDLRCPADFKPQCTDGEVASFECLPVAELVRLLQRHADEVQFKPNVAVVFIDFLMRQGFVSPDEDGYLELLAELRRAECR